jgi:hypothetical protein
MKYNVVSLRVNECLSTVRSNAFTHPSNDPFHRILNDNDAIICVKSILSLPTNDGKFKLESLIAIPSSNKWFPVFNTYDSFEQCRILAHDILNNVMDSGTILIDDILLAKFDLDSGLDIDTGFSILLPTKFTFNAI